LKRQNHAASVFGGMLVIHGGVNPDEGSLYNEMEIFDIGKKNKFYGKIK
jgi:hypothetical protein